MHARRGITSVGRGITIVNQFSEVFSATRLRLASCRVACLVLVPTVAALAGVPSEITYQKDNMNLTISSLETAFATCADCRATLQRLIDNLSGFLYRRRLDTQWTMEFVSAGIRDITGYDSHRFIANASIAFGDLIARSDWKRVNERVFLAASRRQRATVEYMIRTAHGDWLRVEDRFTPVLNTDGEVLAIEGIMDRVRCFHGSIGAESSAAFPPEGFVQLAGMSMH